MKKLRVLANEILKTINNINPSYMKNKFTSNTNAKVHPNDIVVWYHKSTSYDDKSLKVLGPNT